MGWSSKKDPDTADGRNPANQLIWRIYLYTIIYMVLAPCQFPPIQSYDMGMGCFDHQSYESWEGFLGLGKEKSWTRNCLGTKKLFSSVGSWIQTKIIPLLY